MTSLASSISGGQRKRVSIGLELAAAPMALFLNEPTSGLDVSAALAIMALLKRLSTLGVTVMCIIHQPRPEVLDLLDGLTVLHRGHQIYHGGVAGLTNHFSEMGFGLSEKSTLADAVLDIISGHGSATAPGAKGTTPTLDDLLDIGPFLSSALNYTLVPQIGLAAAAPGVKTFGEEKQIYWREVNSGHSRLAYYVGKVLATFPRLANSAMHFTTFYCVLATPWMHFWSMLLSKLLLIIGVWGGYGPPLYLVKEWHLEWLWRLCPGVWLTEVYFDKYLAIMSHLYDLDLAASWTCYVQGRFSMDIGYRLIGYGITDGDTAATAETAETAETAKTVQDGEEWPDIDCKASSLHSDVDSDPELCLAVEAHEPIMSLYAHAMFSEFMWAVAKEVAKRPGERITELRTDDTGNSNTRGSFTLWDRHLSTMAQEIRNTGLGSLDQIYLSIIPPFSAEKLLPEPKEVVTLVKQHAEQLARINHWKQTSDAWYWLLQPANMFPEDGEFYRTAQYEAKDELGRSPLHIAALAGDDELAKLLIRSLADVNLGDMRGGTALHVAAANGEEGIVRLLIANGANMDAADMDGLTPVYAAAAQKQEAIASLLLESGANKNAADHQGSTLLHIAASREDEAVITLLLDYGADQDAVNDKHQTPLHTASATNNAAITRLLIDSGANTEAADEDGQTPLHIVATAMDSIVAELLLDKGADTEARDHEGRTLLHVASPTAGALLLQRGADKHARDKEGREPVLTDQSQEAREYQAQLMLLEQRNRKRMQMARRELG
ncbi:hypothetical protein CHGG_01540 [Chaetomium globosum CBS 148.51]|uniref:Uncharacterized protein n=1 Tax=Chaetomium globosum (strain ATCC 6205 / CBS 148.51 / DSM 1962 / NBRC 6347 / NRRL 1970) TaxID=306901 RepID=Q2HE14_CHAGB|nr:uncharacterized protein CHGG_01540 [Chaetomium globosum CBS 148.51]EAQ93305.1 hypothetical protein CHGG_01540 [Chaetomium globosum CBS 148.51]